MQHNLLSPISKCHQHPWRERVRPSMATLPAADSYSVKQDSAFRVRFIDFAIYLNLIYWSHLVRNGYGRRAFHSLAYQAIEKLLFHRMHIGNGGVDGVSGGIGCVVVASTSQIASERFHFPPHSPTPACCLLFHSASLRVFSFARSPKIQTSFDGRCASAWRASILYVCGCVYKYKILKWSEKRKKYFLPIMCCCGIRISYVCC